MRCGVGGFNVVVVVNVPVSETAEYSLLTLLLTDRHVATERILT